MLNGNMYDGAAWVIVQGPRNENIRLRVGSMLKRERLGMCYKAGFALEWASHGIASAVGELGWFVECWNWSINSNRAFTGHKHSKNDPEKSMKLTWKINSAKKTWKNIYNNIHIWWSYEHKSCTQFGIDEHIQYI